MFHRRVCQSCDVLSCVLQEQCVECVAGPGVGGCVSLVMCCLVCCRNSVWSVLLGLVSEGVSVL